MRIGIVSGVRAELAALLPHAPRTTLGGAPLPVDRIETADHALFLACAGIGKVAAATAAATLVHTHGAEHLLVIGTAGSLGAVGRGPFLITEAVQADFGAMRDERLTHYTAGCWPIASPTTASGPGAGPTTGRWSWRGWSCSRTPAASSPGRATGRSEFGKGTSRRAAEAQRGREDRER